VRPLEYKLMTDPKNIPLHVVLYQPEIPQNTGNIGRTCTALGAKLWIVQPTGFRLDSSRLRRAGLDYWDDLVWESVANWDKLLQNLPCERMWLITKFGNTPYFKADYQPGDILVVGRESNGLPESIREAMPAQCLNIPMPGPVRSLNQASAASIVMYEAARKTGMIG
jgi:tRNA (cytidine/uridine-2'-O-)-methyltransferase